MKRNLAALEKQEFDLLIIGGGITGACIARDAASRGLSVALIEKYDFISATSAAPSKLIHGGLRYLRNFELGLVRESLAERRIWQRIAPHQVHPLPFLLPADEKLKRSLGIGLKLYDLLSFDRNRLDDPAQHLDGHKWHDADTTRAMEPILETSDLDGSYTYLDCQMRSPERLGLECLIDADAHGATLANYVEAMSFLRNDDGAIAGVEATNRLTNATITIRAQMTLNAAGPWADYLMGMAEQGEPSHHLLRSKGIHLITKGIVKSHAVTVSVPEEMGGGHLFLLPWRGHTIFGTTDTAYEGNPDDLEVSEKDIASYLYFINKAVPGATLTRRDVLHAYAGLRPLIADASEPDNPYNASRKAEVVDHEDDGLKGLFSAIGGKWTTSRHVAEKAVNEIGKRLGRRLPKSKTGSTPLPGGHIDRLEDFFVQAGADHPKLPHASRMEIAQTYGSASDQIFDLMNENPSLAARFCKGRDEVAAQIIHGIRHEMAQTLEDIVFRRTGLGTLGDPGEGALAKAADLMAAELGWDGPRKAQELSDVRRLFYAEDPQLK